jgi:hypothetical protein
LGKEEMRDERTQQRSKSSSTTDDSPIHPIPRHDFQSAFDHMKKNSGEIEERNFHFFQQDRTNSGIALKKRKEVLEYLHRFIRMNLLKTRNNF